MVLEQLLRSGRQLVLGAALALSSAYGLGCGGDAQGCVKDTDCKDDRLCIENVCTGPDGSTGDDDDDSWHPSGDGCGDSPFVGKYLGYVVACGIGMITPFSQNCHGTLTDNNQTWEQDFTYSGKRIDFMPIVDHNGIDADYAILGQNPTLNQFATYEYCHHESYSEIPEFRRFEEEVWNNSISRFLCYFDHNSELWYSRYNEEEGICPNPYQLTEIRNSPFDSGNACVDRRNASSWYECEEQFPGPSPSDVPEGYGR